MARDKNEEVPSFTGYVDDPDLWPSTLPQGVTKEGGTNGKHPTWYAFRRTYADGRTEWQFFQRGTAPGPDQPDKVIGTVPGPPIKSVKDAWEKDETKEDKQTDQAERRRVSVTYEGTGANRKRRTVYESGADLVEDAPETAATSPTAQRTAREEAEIAANAALPADQDPRPETNAERAARAEARIKEQGQTAQAQSQRDDTTVVSVEYTGTGQGRQKVTTYKSGRKASEAAPTNATAKGVTYEADGTKVTTYDDGTTTREQLSPAQQRAEQAATQTQTVTEPIQGKDGKQYTKNTVTDPRTGTKRTFYTDANGKEVPLPGEGSATLPNGVQRPQFTPGEISRGLRTMRAQLDDKVKAGDITAAEARQIMADEHQSATVYLNELNNERQTAGSVYGQQLQQRGQDVSMINQRTSAGASMANQAIGTLLPLLRYAQAGSGDPVAALRELMAMGRGNVEQMGGAVNPAGIAPPTQLQGSAGQYVVGGAPVPGAPNQGTVAPVAAPQQGVPQIVQGTVQAAPPQQHFDVSPTVAVPQAAGVPQIVAGSVPAAVAAPTPISAAPQAQMSTTPPAATLPAPVFRPQPEVTLPPPAVMQTVLDMVEPLMAQDPNWGMDDLDLIRQGVGPAGMA